ncbi:MAG: hypothetical protein K0S78_5273 [Thermomicrobiales bacterium]|nr:hypothetical protein [Thermomicrobiales bacterium]
MHGKPDCHAMLRKRPVPRVLQGNPVRSSNVGLITQQNSQASQRLTGALLCAGLIAPVVFTPFVIWAGMITPGYSHISSTFSDSAAQGQPHPEIMGIGLLLLGILLAFFAIGCLLAFPRYNRLVFVPLLLTAFAIGGTGMFHDYSRMPGASRNLEGFLHNAFAVMAILSAVTAILLSGLAARNQPGWSHLFLPALAFAVAAGACGYLFENVSDARDGLAERGFALFALGWTVIVALTALASIDEARLPRSVTAWFSPEPIRDQSAPIDHA